MRVGVSAAALAFVLVCSSPARARDPFGDEGRSEPVPPEGGLDPAPFIAPPPDLYYVTDTYVADVVTTSGPLTTYATTTVHESTGSYARVLETVGTGASSVYDGSAFNGRRSLADGRLVAGTYYENYVLTEGGFVPVSIVFFQDDAELARLLATPTPPGKVIVPPSPSVAAAATRQSPASCCVATPPGALAIPTPTPIKPIRPGISLLPVSAPLSTVEVLRGRAVALFPRAFIDDREVPVRSWTVIDGEAGEALASGGSGGVPFRSSWRRLAPPGVAYQIVFRIDVDTPETGHRTVNGTIAVVVRSPALQD
jgi:hypothetical protein